MIPHDLYSNCHLINQGVCARKRECLKCSGLDYLTPPKWRRGQVIVFNDKIMRIIRSFFCFISIGKSESECDITRRLTRGGFPFIRTVIAHVTYGADVQM